MKVAFLACGVLRLELEKVLQQIKTENLVGCEIAPTYLQAGLCVDFDRLKAAVKALQQIKSESLFGCEIETTYLLHNGEASYPVFERDRRREHCLSGLFAQVAQFLSNPLQGIHDGEIEERGLGRAKSHDEPLLVLHPDLFGPLADVAG